MDTRFPDQPLIANLGRGTYVLIVRLQPGRSLQVGKLGRFDVPAGWYAYVGSALGGLGRRLKRHLAPVSRLHWHIDYLNAAGRLDAIWLSETSVRRECVWASLLKDMPEATFPVPGFGSSDCRCESHLLYFPCNPALDVFQAQVARRFPGDPAVQCFAVGGSTGKDRARPMPG